MPDGGSIPADAEQKLVACGGAKTVVSNPVAFAATCKNGAIVAWGGSGSMTSWVSSLLVTWDAQIGSLMHGLSTERILKSGRWWAASVHKLTHAHSC